MKKITLAVMAIFLASSLGLTVARATEEKAAAPVAEKKEVATEKKEATATAGAKKEVVAEKKADQKEEKKEEKKEGKKAE